MRIQEFSSGGGGSNFPINFDILSKKKKREGRGRGLSIYYAKVMSKSIFAMESFFFINMTSRGVFSRQNHIRCVCFSFVKT